MGEDTLLDFGLVEDKMQGIIKVIGVGGGGCNAVRNMFDEGVQGVTYAVFNTDSQSLSRSPVPVKLMLGTYGLWRWRLNSSVSSTARFHASAGWVSPAAFKKCGYYEKRELASRHLILYH